MAIRDRVERGESAEQARRAVLREFGNVGLVKEVTRDMWGGRSLEQLMQDLRHGARMLLKRPGFAFTAVLTLALGIGANTAIFSVVNAALLRPLPFEHAEQLIMVYSRTSREARASVAYPDLRDWRSQSSSFAHLSAVVTQSVNLTGQAEPGRVIGGFVSADFFQMIGTGPVIGRAFVSGEDEAGAERVAIVNHIVWRDRFGADPNLVGQTLTLNGQFFTVVGIMPEGFRFPYSDVDVWMPIQHYPYLSPDRGAASVEVMGRLKSGVTLPQAQAEMETIAGQLAQQYPDTNKERGVTLANLSGAAGREAAAIPAGIVRRRRLRLTDCLHERGQPPAQPRGQPCQRVGPACRSGR